jgi:sulfonate transport system substrate-binding protein
VQTLGSNKALEFLNAGSIDFGSTAGAAALIARINGNPLRSIYVYSRPEWTALVTRKDSGVARVEDLKGKRVAVTRGTDPHISWCAPSPPRS